MLLHRILIVILSLFIINVNSDNTTTTSSSSDTRIYHFKKCGGAGCPYTASWLVHINLYKRANWYSSSSSSSSFITYHSYYSCHYIHYYRYLDSTKMEAASFSIFDAAPYKFQLSDPDAYYVHHMSMFEHLIHKKQGFQEAQNRTLIMSKSAIIGECGKHLSISKTTEYLALIPFFGGLPPNVTSDFSAVKSIGQGNSLVSPSTKALQCLASLCSVLKYFGHAVIGTTRHDDRLLIEELLDALHPAIKDRVDIIQFNMNKPAHLPFHLLSWGQNYVQNHNCENYGKSNIIPLKENHIEDIHDYHREKFEKKLTTEGDEYSICKDNVKQRQHGTPYQVVSHKKSPYYEKIYKDNSLSGHLGKVAYPIRYVYYSENDQIVRFDSDATFYALSAACNDSTFFTGRRKEKLFTSDPIDYMGELVNWRNCGTPGWSMEWPQTRFVRVTQPNTK